MLESPNITNNKMTFAAGLAVFRFQDPVQSQTRESHNDWLNMSDVKIAHQITFLAWIRCLLIEIIITLHRLRGTVARQTSASEVAGWNPTAFHPTFSTGCTKLESA
ncbi:hypothetical protein XENTR_v10014068 [Xenopus tropicalis]|nr:hypothetical protein XENTR_v10014068 [Xenopus tropicalis]